MNAKAEKFKAYYDEHDPKAFTAEEVKDDPMHMVVFRSSIVVKGQHLPLFVLADDSIYSITRVIIAGQAVNDDNRAKIVDFLNLCNQQYKISKFFVAQDGTIVLDCCIAATDEQFDPAMIYVLIRDAVFPCLNDHFTEIMEKI